MSIEWFLKRSPGLAGSYGESWTENPCVAITKNGLTFNRLFVSAFGLERGSLLMIGCDKESRRLYFKKPVRAEEELVSFTMSGGKGGLHAKAIGTLCTSNKKATNAFPECLGKAFRAKLNAGQMVIEVQL